MIPISVACPLNISKTELVLAIYEVGQCFFQGWGVPKDQKMAMVGYTYSQVALFSVRNFPELLSSGCPPRRS